MTAVHNILLVEDDALDVKLIEKAMRSIEGETSLSIARDGYEALEMLETGATPHLIITDLKMPRMNGHQLLDKLKTDPRFRQIPVIVLSTSDDKCDVVKSYESHASSYMVKPSSASSYRNIASRIREYWFQTAALPA